MAEFFDIGPFDRLIVRGSSRMSIGVPTSPMQSTALDGGHALWLGPDEFLFVLPENAGEALTEQLAADADCISVVDVSHRQLALRLEGDEAATLLNGAVPLDLAESAFPVGMCTRTIFDKAEIVLWRRGAAEWHIEVARSFAPYVRALLAAIATANGIPLSTPEPEHVAR